jgi:thymidylate synthase (FAD)
LHVLDKGIVELKSSMGGDLFVVAAARVSNGLTLEESSKGEDGDFKLIRYLMKHRHGTPFEHAVFTFYVKCPLFVRSEWHRHRIASYNEISGRYVQYDPEFYVPSEWRVPGATNKQGSSSPESSPQTDEWNNQNLGVLTRATRDAYASYLLLLDNGVAKEMARMILPLNLYTQFYFTVNARSLMNFLSLRNAEDAQYEIRQYAVALESIFLGLMPLTHRAWVENGRIAP